MEENENLKQVPDTGYQRLEQQIKWYDTRSLTAQKWYKRLKLLEIIIAALIPVIANSLPVAAALFGAGIVILEGIQNINQWDYKWRSYRSNCEALMHEKYAYLGKFGPYSNLNDDEALRLLGERTELLISTEHTKWVKTQEQVLSAKVQDIVNS